MKPHPRIRKTIKWGGAAVTVLLVVVWIGSGWWIARWLAPGSMWSIERGCVAVMYDANLLPLGEEGLRLQRRASDPSLAWWIAYRLDGTFRAAIVPLWIPVVLSAAVTWWMWRGDVAARRRERGHLCSKCGYDRTGLAPDVKCPECGGASVNR